MKKYRFLTVFLLLLALTAALAAPACASEPITIDAAAAILVDADYNEVLYELNADERRPPASITKGMTGLLTVEAIDRGELDMDTRVTLQDDLYTGIGEGGSTQGLKAGEILTVQDLLYCALLPSANEACNALATAVAGSIPAFVEQMNQRSAALGMTNTHFVNTHGYHDAAHYTTARDIAKMCAEAMKHPDFREIVSSVRYDVPETNLHAARELHDTNALVSNHRTGNIGLLYRYAIGIKTGSTPEAGSCLASAAEKNDRLMIAVVLGSQDYRKSDTNSFSESKKLLEYGFNSFSRKELLSPIDPIDTVPVKYCAQQDYVTVQASQGLEATLPNDLDPALFQRRIELPEDLEAPIEKGQVLGTISISYEGKDYGSADLIATTALVRSQLVFILDNLQALFSRLWVKILLLVVILLLLLLVMRRMVFGPSRRKRYNTPRTYSSSYRGRKR